MSEAIRIMEKEKRKKVNGKKGKLKKSDFDKN